MTAENADDVMRTLWARIDAADWDGLRDLLAPEFRAEWVDTREMFDRESFVRVNREYPGRWFATVEEVLRDGTRAVTRTRVTDGKETYYVSSFGEVHAGKVTRLVEVWASGDATPPPDRRPKA